MSGDAPLDPAAFYDEYGERGWARLDRDFHHRLEWEATVDYLERGLPGSGARRRRRRRAVRRLARAPRPRRDAPRCRPRTGRPRPREGRRARDAGPRGGPVFVSVMGLLASVTRVMRAAGRVDEERDETELLPALARSGDYDAALLDRFDREPAMGAMHLFRAAEFESLLEAAGLEVRTLAALEGPFSQRREDLDLLTDAHCEAIREPLERLREDRCVVDHSAHMLAVCRA